MNTHPEAFGFRPSRQPLIVSDAATARRLSPVTASVCAQDRLEPILLDYARSFRDADIRFGREVVSFTQDSSGVLLVVAGGKGFRKDQRHSGMIGGGDSFQRSERIFTAVCLEV